MVPHVAERGHSFIGAGKYYLHDKKALTSERVAWTETLNLPTRDAAKALKCMAWTAIHAGELKAAAGGSAKGRKATQGPVYTYSLSWEKDAAPTEENIREAARASLKVLGLSGHEAVLVRHTDTDHDHVHVIVNLVHPETGIRAKLSNDRLKLSEWAESYEREHGKIVCPQRVENNARRRNGEFVKHREAEAAQAPTINELYQSADSGRAFAAAVQAELGLTLARGHRGRVVLVDEAGKVIALARQLEGEKDIKAKLADLDMKALPDATALSEERLATAQQDALAREIVEPMQHEEALQAAAEEQARDELAWEQAQAAEMEAARDRHEAKLQEARQLWQDIVEPRQRQEDLQAALGRTAQEEQSHRLAQVIDFADARDRFEAKLREAKWQAQELVEPRQPHAAVIANDNRGQPPPERGAEPDPTRPQLKSSRAKGRSLSRHGLRTILPRRRAGMPSRPSSAPCSGRAMRYAGSRRRRGNVWNASRPSEGAGNREAGNGSGRGFLRHSAGCSVSSRRPRDGPEGSSSPTTASAGSGSGLTPSSSARARSCSSGTSNYASSGRSWWKGGGWWTASASLLRGRVAGLWRTRHRATPEAAQAAAAPLPPPCRISRGGPGLDF